MPTKINITSDKKEKFLSLLSAPARRALENKGITSLKKLSNYTEKEISILHGIGKTTLLILQNALESAGLKFKDIS